MLFDEEGNVCHKSSVHILSPTEGKKELFIEFGCGCSVNSIDRKVVLNVGTSADVNAINKKTFNEPFPGTELQPSSVVPENIASKSNMHPAYWKVHVFSQKERKEIQS